MQLTSAFLAMAQGSQSFRGCGAHFGLSSLGVILVWAKPHVSSTVWSWPILSVGGKYEAAEGNYLKEAISDFGGRE